MILFDTLMPLVRALDAETAHKLTVKALSLGVGPVERERPDPVLSQTLFGLGFDNPVGLAPGFDKNAECWKALLRLGVGYAEVGTITPRPQPGNPRPRLFRLPEDRAVINRMGFNNEGAEAAYHRLHGRDRALGIVGVNIGANKDSDDPAEDYAKGMAKLAALADYVTINVSSPNTPGLRDLQGEGALGRLLELALKARDAATPNNPPPVLLKIAPDLVEGQLGAIIETAVAHKIDGLIVSNTTITRPESLVSAAKGEAGGLSGRPLFEPSTRMLAEAFKLVDGRMPIIGVGGIEDGETAYQKIKAGASLLQLYSALVYAGPGLFRRVRRELAEKLKSDGFSSIKDAIGVDADRIISETSTS